MEKIIFKKSIRELAEKYSLEVGFGAFFKEFEEVLIVIDLQKSNFSSLYYFNINSYVQGAFGEKYIKSKELVRRPNGHLFIRPPEKYTDCLDLECKMPDDLRINKLKILFEDFLLPYINSIKTKKEIIKNYQGKESYLAPSIEKEIYRLGF